VAPVELCEIELVAIRIFESDERTGLAFVDDLALKTNALGFQRADRRGSTLLAAARSPWTLFVRPDFLKRPGGARW